MRDGGVDCVAILPDYIASLPAPGGEISAIASLRHYRVNDVAAGLIAVVVGVPYQSAKTPAVRDLQVADLRTKR